LASALTVFVDLIEDRIPEKFNPASLNDPRRNGENRDNPREILMRNPNLHENRLTPELWLMPWRAGRF
jgi:hypothetical protein